MAIHMCLKLKRNKKNAFLLLEVLTALSILSFFLPSLFKDQKLYYKEVKKISFYNQLESAFKKHLFEVFGSLYEDPYYSLIEEMDLNPRVVAYKDIVVGNKTYRTFLTLQKEEEAEQAVNYQIKASLKVVGLPYEKKDYQSNIQNLYLKKSN